MPIPPFLLPQHRANKRGPGPPSAPRGGAASGSGSWKDGMAEPGWSRASPSLERALGGACGGCGAARGEPLGMVIGFPLGMATGSLQKRHRIPPRVSQNPSKKRHRIHPSGCPQDPSTGVPGSLQGSSQAARTEELHQGTGAGQGTELVCWALGRARGSSRFSRGHRWEEARGKSSRAPRSWGIPAAGACGTAAPVFPGFGSGMLFHGVGNWYPPAQPGPGVTGNGESVIPNLSAP